MLEILLSIFALVTLSLLGAMQGNLEREGDPRASAVSLARLLWFALYVALLFVLQISNAPFAALLAAAVVAVFVGQQLLGKLLVNSPVGMKLTAQFDAAISGLSALLKPLRFTTPVATEEFEQELIESVEDFSETLVREIMVPRVDLEIVEAEQNLEEALSIFISSGYSRLPVVGESIDDVVGVLYLKDLARVTHKDPALLATTSAKEAARKPLFIPETKPVHELLQEMKTSQTQIAIVSDEYGGVAGIATMEDLIEELVGDISDEYDREGDEIERIGANLYRVDPKLSLAELSEEIEIDLEDEDVDTVGGLLSKVLGELPKGGEIVAVMRVELTAERVDPKKQRVLSILVRTLPETDD